MSNLILNDNVIGGSSNDSSDILYTPSDRVETNVQDELDKINTDLTSLETLFNAQLNTEEIVGKLGNQTIYRKIYAGSGYSASSDILIDGNMTPSRIGIIKMGGVTIWSGGMTMMIPWYYGTEGIIDLRMTTSGLSIMIRGTTVTAFNVEVYYIKL